MSAAQGTVARLTAELEAERGQHGRTRESLTAVSTELVTVKARAEAQAGVQADQSERLRRVERELTKARESAAAAREDAAKLAGQTAALTAQQAELLRVIEGRSGPRQGGKKG